MAQELSEEEIKKIASLSKLDFTDEELQGFKKEFNNILNYISMIKECDTSDIEFEHNMDDYPENPLQEDVVTPSLNRDKVLMNATDGRNKYGYIRTSKIVTKE